MAHHYGSCHCRRIRFRVEGRPEHLTLCNCSICRRTAYLHWEVEPERVQLESEDGDWHTYRFGTGVAEHRFCKTCGISPFRVSRSAPGRIDINVRCLEDMDAESLPRSVFDGVHWEESFRARRRREEGS